MHYTQTTHKGLNIYITGNSPQDCDFQVKVTGISPEVPDYLLTLLLSEILGTEVFNIDSLVTPDSSITERLFTASIPEPSERPISITSLNDKTGTFTHMLSDVTGSHEFNAEYTCHTSFSIYSKYETREEISVRNVSEPEDNLPDVNPGQPIEFNEESDAPDPVSQEELDIWKRYDQLSILNTNTFRKKNHDYGNSVAESYKEYEAYGQGEGLKYCVGRLGDKMRRIKQIAFTNSGNQVADETVADTLLDLANYCYLTLMAMDYRPQEKR